MQQSWRQVAEQLGNRTARQCYDEWLILKRSPCSFFVWSRSDERLLLELVSETGRDWKKVQQHFPQYSFEQLRNKCRALEVGKLISGVQKSEQYENSPSLSEEEAKQVVVFLKVMV